MDRYQRVEKPREEAPVNENEIRITTQGRMRNYISYATSLLQEKGSDEIVCKAMGRAINKTVMIAELIKRRIAGLHQKTSIGSIDITDTWEPLEEGLLPLETTRHVSMIMITLSRKELGTSLVGYQPPLPSDQVKPWSTEFEYEGGSSAERGRGRGGRGRGRGYARGNGNMVAYYEDLDNGDQGYGRGGWSRGRGRGGYGGRGMGGYAGRNDYQREAGGRGMRGGYAGRDDYQNEAGGRGMRGGYAGRGDYQHEAGGHVTRGGYDSQPDYQHETGGRVMRGGYGGRTDYQHEAGGYGMRGGFRGRGMRGGYGGRDSDYQYETPGFNDEAHSRGRGRGRGMGRSRGWGRGGFRPN